MVDGYPNDVVDPSEKNLGFFTESMHREKRGENFTKLRSVQ
jgi:hypothetical protein